MSLTLFKMRLAGKRIILRTKSSTNTRVFIKSKQRKQSQAKKNFDGDDDLAQLVRNCMTIKIDLPLIT